MPECKYITNKYVYLQAEDGIRVAQESRGLGDVYNRQTQNKEKIIICNALNIYLTNTQSNA